MKVDSGTPQDVGKLIGRPGTNDSETSGLGESSVEAAEPDLRHGPIVG